MLSFLFFFSFLLLLLLAFWLLRVITMNSFEIGYLCWREQPYLLCTVFCTQVFVSWIASYPPDRIVPRVAFRLEFAHVSLSELGGNKPLKQLVFIFSHYVKQACHRVIWLQDVPLESLPGRVCYQCHVRQHFFLLYFFNVFSFLVLAFFNVFSFLVLAFLLWCTFSSNPTDWVVPRVAVIHF